MKKSNKKGFTIVELVIVIAVIAILAAVLIPTFSNVVNKANESKAMQQARIAYENYLAENADKVDLKTLNICIKVDDTHYFYVENGQFKADSKAACKSDNNYQAATVNGELLTINTNTEGHTHS